MTEYDYSPEAYERYLATQTRIANWVEKTEQHRPHFQPAVSSGSPPQLSYDPPSKPKHTPPPPPPYYYPHQYAQPQQRRQLYIHPPPPGSESSDDYGDGPGPMPLSNPGVMFPPQHYPAQPMGHPMLPPPPIMVPQTYVIPSHKPARHHRPHSLRSHSRSRSHHAPAYYSMASPPVSPGYQHHYPPVIGGQPGYFMMQPHRGSQVPIMVSTSS